MNQQLNTLLGICYNFDLGQRADHCEKEDECELWQTCMFRYPLLKDGKIDWKREKSFCVNTQPKSEYVDMETGTPLWASAVKDPEAAKPSSQRKPDTSKTKETMADKKKALHKNLTAEVENDRLGMFTSGPNAASNVAKFEGEQSHTSYASFLRNGLVRTATHRDCPPRA